MYQRLSALWVSTAPQPDGHLWQVQANSPTLLPDEATRQMGVHGAVTAGGGGGSEAGSLRSSLLARELCVGRRDAVWEAIACTAALAPAAGAMGPAERQRLLRGIERWFDGSLPVELAGTLGSDPARQLLRCGLLRLTADSGLGAGVSRTVAPAQQT
jgi:hypothetical protein|eukprot:COSAG06_NODE_10190_length_1732_cov_1.178812_3_plen_157_part_00